MFRNHKIISKTLRFVQWFWKYFHLKDDNACWILLMLYCTQSQDQILSLLTFASTYSTHICCGDWIKAKSFRYLRPFPSIWSNFWHRKDDRLATLTFLSNFLLVQVLSPLFNAIPLLSNWIPILSWSFLSQEHFQLTILN